MNEDIGSKVKELRTNAKMTLRELSEKTSLSTGFLSQLERGLTSIATDSLMKIADALDVELSYFFMKPTKRTSTIMRSYEKEVMRIDNAKYINYLLTPNAYDKKMTPRLVEILPSNSDENLDQYQHEGEEFLYVLEGVLTLFINDERHELYPGDSAHYSSRVIHNYANYTNKMVRIIEVSTPNYFNEEGIGSE